MPVTFREVAANIGDDLRFFSSGMGRGLRARAVVWFLNLSFQCLLLYRLSNYCIAKPRLGWASAMFSYLAQVLTGCHVNPHSIIGRRVRFSHPNGIVIGSGVVIEDDVTIYQNVTLGATGIGGKSYPRICAGSVIYAGASVLGNVIVGPGAVVGSNAVVLADVPSRAVAVGIPARILKQATESHPTA